MKRLSYILLLFSTLSLVLFSSCRKDEFIEESDIEFPDSVEVEDPTIDTEVTFKMSGEVESPGGSPIKNAEVNLYHGGDILMSTTTNEFGQYDFDNLDPSEHNYFVESVHEGFTNNIKSRTIDNEDEEADFILVKDNNNLGITTTVDPTNTELISIYGHLYLLDQITPAREVIVLVSAYDAVNQDSFYNYAISDENGFYELLVPKDQPLSISSLTFCSENLEVNIAQSYNETTELPDAYVVGTPTSANVSGRLLGCDGIPLETVTIWFLDPYFNVEETIQLDNGYFDITHFNCGEEIYGFPIIFMDEQGNTLLEILFIDEESQDIGEIDLCEIINTSEYTCNVDIGNLSIEIPNMASFNCSCGDNFAITIVNNEETSWGPSIAFDLDGFDLANYSLDTYNNTFNVTHFYLDTFEDIYINTENSNLTATVTDFDNGPNGFIEGSFKGTVLNQLNYEEIAIFAEFKAYILQ